MTLSRYRIHFGKNGPLRFTGHLDLQRTWERTLRRARLPIAYSGGFHPRAKLLFAAPLPLGFCSTAERVDVWLTDDQSAEEIHAKITTSLPPGITLYSTEKLAPNAPSLASIICGARYEAACTIKVGALTALQHALARVLNTAAITRVRRDKTYDLRPLIRSINLRSDSTTDPVGEQKATLRLDLVLLPNAAGRPEEVLDELGLDGTEAEICRTDFLFSTPLSTPSECCAPFDSMNQPPASAA